VRLRSQQARTAGIDGIVCSAAEADIVREAIGDRMVIVTPGIRPDGSASGDQKRTLTPAEAIKAGVDHMVIGRPIIRAADPRGVASAIMDEIARVS
jgi:orotidine-5'-phosphate decarboxylase